MSRIQLGVEAVEKLQGVSDDVEICDANGEVIGYFRPKAVGKILRLRDLSPYTDEEIREFAKRKEGARPLDEVLRDLGAL